MHDACCCCPGILGNRYSSTRGPTHGPSSVRGKYIWPLPVIGPVVM